MGGNAHKPTTGPAVRLGQSCNTHQLTAATEENEREAGHIVRDTWSVRIRNRNSRSRGLGIISGKKKAIFGKLFRVLSHNARGNRDE